MSTTDYYTAEHQVYEPHKVGIPPVGPYLREVWRRREFALELSRTHLRAQHANTFFGQLWLIINPLMLGLVYFVLVDILRGGSRGGEFFAHLIAGLFAYYYVNWAVSQGVRSITTGGRLILNTAFPRVLLPLASVHSAFRRFLPTLLVLAVVHFAVGLDVQIEMLWVLFVIAQLTVLASGLAIIVAALQVYFRDLKAFLPYALRMWLYTSPVLYYAYEVPDRYEFILWINPLAPLLTIWSDALQRGVSPETHVLVLAIVWPFAILLVAFAVFTSREREFAVRL